MPAIDARRQLGAAAARDLEVDDVRRRSAMRPAPGVRSPAPSSRATSRSTLAQLERRPWPSVLVGILFLVVCLFAAAGDVDAGDETCHAIDVTWYSPSGVAGCTLDGATAGVASTYPGDVAAANWCTWPWDDCGAVRVQSHVTGVVITVPVAMYCDCWWMSDRRLVDLTPGQVAALGLDPADGLFAVTVTPISQPGRALEDGHAVSTDAPAPALPNTAAAAP